MKLSDLVRVRQSFNAVSTNALSEEINNLDKTIDIASINMDLNYTDSIENLHCIVNNINSSVTEINTVLDSLTQNLDQKIFDLSRPYCVTGNVVNGIKNVSSVDAETDRLTRSIVYDDETNFNIVSKIREYTNPIFPSLEIGPGDGYWTKHMVAADPLYLVDINKEFLDSAVSQFNDVYQRRIRTYQLNTDGIGPADLSILPKNQFGFVLAISVFDFMTLDFITEYVNQVFNVLRPGGTFMFTYNNCADFKSARLVETGFKGWATEKEMISICRDAGFDIANSYNKIDNVHWLEIKKPGSLTTVKTHQALGEICSYSA